MSNGASMDYKFGPKNNWRRWKWNRIREAVDRIKVKASEAVVIYLAGAKDLDRTEAMRRGFRWDNLIAVERDAGSLRALRGQRVLTVNGDLLDVCWSWKNESVHVLDADFCCGLSNRSLALLELLPFLADFRNCVLSFNLLRGREAWSGEFKAALQRAFHDQKHRGEIARTISVATAGRFAQFNLPSLTFADAMGSAKVLALWEHSSTSSYISESGQVFDSAIWRNPSVVAMPFESLAEKSGDFLRRQGWRPPSGGAKANRVNFIGNRIAAIKAHRTMRLQAA